MQPVQKTSIKLVVKGVRIRCDFYNVCNSFLIADKRSLIGLYFFRKESLSKTTSSTVFKCLSEKVEPQFTIMCLCRICFYFVFKINLETEKIIEMD